MQVVTVAGGTLFGVAEIYLGDATLWQSIAALNTISDPWLDGLTTLRLPDIAIGSGGSSVGV